MIRDVLSVWQFSWYVGIGLHEQQGIPAPLNHIPRMNIRPIYRDKGLTKEDSRR